VNLGAPKIVVGTGGATGVVGVAVPERRRVVVVRRVVLERRCWLGWLGRVVVVGVLLVPLGVVAGVLLAGGVVPVLLVEGVPLFPALLAVLPEPVEPEPEPVEPEPVELLVWLLLPVPPRPALLRPWLVELLPVDELLLVL
jgi:hypothetical protein